MLRLSLRHIDLVAVYEQLDKYDPLQGSESCLANIPQQLSEILSYRLDEIAGMVIEDLFDAPRTTPHPNDIAAEVEEFIGQAISLLDEGNYPSYNDDGDDYEDSTREALDKFAVLPLTDAYISADYWQITALLIYQYDYLCWLYQQKAYEDALELFVTIADTQCRAERFRVEGLVEEVGGRTASERASALAQKRHARTNEIKIRLLEEWDKTGSTGGYTSRADFSSVIAKREGIKERTLYEWIAKHDKSK